MTFYTFSICFNDGEFISDGLMLQKGSSLGTGTNNNAEAVAMATAVKMAFRR